MEVKFEWDEKKNAKNLLKHGIFFEDTLDVFKDPKRIEMYDKAHSFFEDRWMVVGLNNSTILTIFFTERNNTIRIISARKADKNDKEEYSYGYGATNY